MKRILANHIVFICIFFFGLSTRFFGINWDQGFHLHPDERAIILFTLPLRFPHTLSQLLSPESTWNPHFFAYGSLPLYLLYSASSLVSYFSSWFASYDGMLYVGRSISALADLGVITVLFLLGKKYFSKNIGLLASFFYLTSTFALQAAHFYAVDTLLTLFCLLSLFCLIEFNATHKKRKLIGFAVFFAFAMSTKISAILLVIPLLLTICYQIHVHLSREIFFSTKFISSLRHLSYLLLLIVPVTVLVVFLCMPYAFLDFSEFHKQLGEQSAMTKSAWTFPYTLQYVGKVPYLYELSQIFFWGQGPFLALICLGGIIYTTLFLFTHPEKKKLGIFLSFFWIYFLVVGNFSVGFMRYMLPLYPILCLTGAIFFDKILSFLSGSIRPVFLSGSLLLLAFLPLSFLHIYTNENTKVQATNFILKNIPQGSTLAVEHWDDQIPLVNAANYPTETLELYNEDTPAKWTKINEQLRRTDYLILASNRLYTPLAKLTHCEKLLPHPCYKQTATYYKELFSETRGFEKVVEFTAFPTIPFLNLPINDQSADESFTVYDHSRVIIYKRVKP